MLAVVAVEKDQIQLEPLVLGEMVEVAPVVVV